MPSSLDGPQEALEVERDRQDERPPAELERDQQLAVAAGHVEQRHVDERRQRRTLRLVDPDARNAFSVFARKFACEVIAPFGKPVVPLV